MVNSGVLSSIVVEDIELDRSNPRIRKFLEMYGDQPTPEQIFLALGAGNDDDSGNSTSTTFEKLKQSIITNGGIIQPVILNPSLGRFANLRRGQHSGCTLQTFLEDECAG